MNHSVELCSGIVSVTCSGFAVPFGWAGFSRGGGIRVGTMTEGTAAGLQSLFTLCCLNTFSKQSSRGRAVYGAREAQSNWTAALKMPENNLPIWKFGHGSEIARKTLLVKKHID